VWEMYLNNNVGAPINLVKAKNLSPLSYIYKEQDNDTTEPFAIALDEATADDEVFKSHFDTFPNYEVIIVPNYSKEDLADIPDFKKFSSQLPSELTKEQKQEIFNLVKEPEPVDEIFTKEYWKNSIGNLLEKAGVK
jgi:hypothetical protein